MTSLNEYKDTTMRIVNDKGWGDITTELLFMLLTEEIGELASAIRRASHNFSDRKKSNLTGEWFDVLSYLLQIADRFDIDLDSSFEDYVRQLKSRRTYGFPER